MPVLVLCDDESGWLEGLDEHEHRLVRSEMQLQQLRWEVVVGLREEEWLEEVVDVVLEGEGVQVLERIL